MADINFDAAFEALTGNAPFPWQRALYERFTADRKDNIPESCNLPTGLGKTSVIAVWLIALATHPTKMPRRLVYVVNRRTVVDQTTDEVVKIRERLPKAPQIQDALWELCAVRPDKPDPENDRPLAISTLRGQFADNREWSADPSRPAVICGTVDMIGSRLLFSGYGIGRYDRTHQVGFLGCDTLLVHDEAHLTDPFQQLLAAIRRNQWAEQVANRNLRVLELTATSRRGSDAPAPFTLSPTDETHPVVAERLTAGKTIRLHTSERITLDITKLATEYRLSGRAILVFVQTPDQVNEVVAALKKLEGVSVCALTGTMRGYNRDRLVDCDSTFARYLPKPKIDPAPGTVYLVCTSAGEVGVDLSADHLICDLTTFESMAQRFGRVNRRGGRDPLTNELRHAYIDVVHEPKIDTATPRGERRERTWKLLERLVDEFNGSASPNSLRMNLTEAEKNEAFAPAVPCLETTEFLLDTWALTTITDDLPGRPPVAPWLHGVEPPDQPTTAFAWRTEVESLALPVGTPSETVEEREKEIVAYLEEYPLLVHEQLAEKTARLVSVPNTDTVETGRRQQLKEFAKRGTEHSAWLIDANGRVDLTTIGKLAESSFTELMGRTVVLPPSAGGLSAAGMLDGREANEAGREYDVADWVPNGGTQTRYREFQFTNEDGILIPRPVIGERLDSNNREGRQYCEVADIVTVENAEGDVTGRFVAFVATDALSGERSRSQQSSLKQFLDDHLTQAEHYATVLAERVLPAGPEQVAVKLAAKWHDLGKNRRVWQRGIGNPPPPPIGDWRPLAKSGSRGRIFGLNDYRHEFGSLLDVRDLDEFKQCPEEVRELVLHLIAAHHGRARPHFPVDLKRDPPCNEAFDPEPRGRDEQAMAREIPQRFAKLQRKYGRWGLAHLESLVRAADILASQRPREGGK
ncbi:crispr-associated helicase cas3 : CRISPR-associated helicase Cas3 OS=Geobacter sulfurreducens (strain ATCC 51573 / DSM 12127 / PCA) GN=cas3-1 PE=4 SV=1: ResIII: Helicase_C [Gemmata massiliana]|uniref:HD Cas3-type domain-containing protein n=1 Tax=Gemmata massiliana TaxID=1210884 RepID=A0A6P2CXB4_9BACT|nr:type I-U CRISPR-associated helicase/endonuclease Cas3 [Gemmata massiliana]VTR93599.1 crispr-associated helicase cas3 : CRISPR-associated helicase Cas3 OS=Geobacter sulfurreducens (strain ATCC 51573 / DSM 12127 / PCA) GN=cas3-1 PE=4 SV=1: ResIII: Helicase_C [Gemmata massiliana]